MDRFGPGWAVAAAFLGPGTVTTALTAGADFGTGLLWAIPLSAAVTVVLQEAAGRLTLAGGKTLGEALPDLAPGGARKLVAGLVLAAVVAGAAAFQVGNLLGAALALDALLGVPPWFSVLAVADVAFVVLWIGQARGIDRLLGVLVAVMAVAFVVDLALLPVDWGRVAAGLVPQVPTGAAAVAVALVGTTVVPYNLFLHGSLSRDHGWDVDDVPAMRRDLLGSVGVGAALTAALLIAGATVLGPGDLAGQGAASAMASTLAPLLGTWAAAVFGVGLLAAAFTSSVTAPLAAAYAAAHVLDLDDDRRSDRFRLVWIGVLGVGTALAAIGLEPVPAIVAAQAANGLLLPVVAVAVLVAVNRSDLVGEHINDRAQNAAGLAAVGAAVLLGAWLVWTGLT